MGEGGGQRGLGGAEGGHFGGSGGGYERLARRWVPRRGRGGVQQVDPVGEEAFPVVVPAPVGHPLGQIDGLVGHLGFTVALLFDADCLNVVRGYIGVVLTHPELEEGLESVLKAGLGGVMATDAARAPPTPV